MLQEKSYQMVTVIDKGKNVQMVSMKLDTLVKPTDLLLIRKFVGRMNDSKRKIINGQIF